jgi:GNAT superfamily N-acetyltransferase/L-amino acid N-acyltransferase YncA
LWAALHPDYEIGSDMQGFASEATIEVIAFDAMAANQAQWNQFHAYRRARHAESRPGDPLLSDQDIEDDERDPDPYADHLRWVAAHHNRIVGNVETYLLRPSSPDFAERARFLHAYGAVLRPWRGRGIGTKLVAQVHGLMLAHAKTILTLSAQEPDGHGFLRHIGASEKTRGFEKRLLIEQVDWAAVERRETAALASLPGSSFVHHGPRVGRETHEALIPVIEELWQDVPFDQLEHAPIRIAMSEIDEWHRQLDRIGGAEHVVVLRDRDGSVVGLTEAGWFSRTPDRVYQRLTGVRCANRGAGYAIGLKAAMLREIRTHYPSVSEIITYVGQSNLPMLSINRKLGFKTHREFGTYQIQRDDLGAWLGGKHVICRT